MLYSKVRRFGTLLVLGVCVAMAGCGLSNAGSDTADAAPGTTAEPAESVLDFVPLAVEPAPCGAEAFVEGLACLVPVGDVIGDDIVESAEVLPNELDNWTISVVMTPDGIIRFNEVAASCFERDEICPSGRLGIVSDGELVSSPMIQAPSFERDQIVISGNFTQKDVSSLIEALNS